MSSLKAQLAFWPFKWGDGVHALHTSAVKNKSGAGLSLSCLWQCKLLHQDFLQDSLRLPGPQDLLHNPPRLSETPFLVYQKSSSLPLPLLGGITVIGYWTRSSLPRARLSIGDRFTSEKPLLDGPLHRDTAIPGYCNTTPHYTSLVLAFHWWGIYPSLGSAIKMLLTGKFSYILQIATVFIILESCGIDVIILLQATFTLPLRIQDFSGIWLVKFHQITKQAFKMLVLILHQ